MISNVVYRAKHGTMWAGDCYATFNCKKWTFFRMRLAPDKLFWCDAATFYNWQIRICSDVTRWERGAVNLVGWMMTSRNSQPTIWIRIEHLSCRVALGTEVLGEVPPTTCMIRLCSSPQKCDWIDAHIRYCFPTHLNAQRVSQDMLKRTSTSRVILDLYALRFIHRGNGSPWGGQIVPTS